MTRTADLINALIDSGLSQMEVSRLTGIPQPRLSRWQAGEAPKSADDVLRLAELADRMLPAHRSARTTATDHSAPEARQEAA